MADIDSYLADVIRVKSKGSSILKNMVKIIITVFTDILNWIATQPPGKI
jgi:hypothetical protein